MFDGILTKNTALKINNEDIILIKSKESLFNIRAIIVANTGCKYIYTLTTEGFKDFKFKKGVLEVTLPAFSVVVLEGK